MLWRLIWMKLTVLNKQSNRTTVLSKLSCSTPLWRGESHRGGDQGGDRTLAGIILISDGDWETGLYGWVNCEFPDNVRVIPTFEWHLDVFHIKFKKRNDVWTGMFTGDGTVVAVKVIPGDDGSTKQMKRKNCLLTLSLTINSNWTIVSSLIITFSLILTELRLHI